MRMRLKQLWVAGLAAAGVAIGSPKVNAQNPPEGVEVRARGPIHEAFASTTEQPTAAPVVAKPTPEAARFDFNWLAATGSGCFLAAKPPRRVAPRQARACAKPLTPHRLLWPSPPSSGRHPRIQKALRFHDLRPL